MPENIYYRSIEREAVFAFDKAAALNEPELWQTAERLYLRAHFLADDARDKAFADMCHRFAERCAGKLGRGVQYNL
jgi:hypothetical protein